MNSMLRRTRYASCILVLEVSVMSKDDHAFQVVKFYRYETISLVCIYVYLIAFISIDYF